jgi:pimeloyl-ACP methyl ester carboxylesterase
MVWQKPDCQPNRLTRFHPKYGGRAQAYFDDVTSVVVAQSGHFVPEEQPAALANALMAFFDRANAKRGTSV